MEVKDAGHHNLEPLTLCMLGNFACWVILHALLSADFLKIIFSKKLQEYHWSAKQFGSIIQIKPAQQFVGHDLGPNCLQTSKIATTHTKTNMEITSLITTKIRLNIFRYS